MFILPSGICWGVCAVMRLDHSRGRSYLPILSAFGVVEFIDRWSPRRKNMSACSSHVGASDSAVKTYFDLLPRDVAIAFMCRMSSRPCSRKWKAFCSARPRYDAQTRKVWVWDEIWWFTYFLVWCRGPHLKGFSHSGCLVRALGFASSFALAFSLWSLPLSPLSRLLRALPHAARALYRILNYCWRVSRSPKFGLIQQLTWLLARPH